MRKGVLSTRRTQLAYLLVEEQILRGMIIENLTQRANEFKEEVENLTAIRNYLKKTAVQPVNTHLSDGRKAPPQNIQEQGSIRNIIAWLNKSGEVMSVGKVSSLLNIYDNLDS